MRTFVLLSRILAIFLVAPSPAKEVFAPPNSVDIASLTPAGGATVANGTLTFLNDHSIAVGVCYKSACNLRTYDLTQGQPRLIGEAIGIEHFHALLRGENSQLILGGVRKNGERGALVLDQSLQNSRFVQKTPGVSVSGEPIPHGPGTLLAHGANMAAYVDGNSIRIYGADGKLLGAFKTSTANVHSMPEIAFLGADRLLLTNESTREIRDFDGAVLRKLKRTRGALGERIKLSGDGNFLLYDSFVRQVGAVQSAVEKAGEVASMGMSADGYVPDSEVVRVVDTKSGKQCFVWSAKDHLLPPFVDHADIDPSGRLVAIMTRGTLAIFQLPESCEVK